MTGGTAMTGITGMIAPAAAGPSPTAWDALARELDAWAATGRVAAFWWRDDDAADSCPALERLFALSAAAGVPLMLAVIPARATATLSAALLGLDGAVLQHGYAHANHAPAGSPKSELGPARPLAARLADLAAGRARLASWVGARLLPVLVPPWNRIGDDLIDALPAAGFRAFSTFRPRPAPCPRAGLLQVNTHLDLIDWAGTRRFVGEGAALAAVIDHLAAKRAARAGAAPEEPTGILSHHLAMDEASWSFLDRLLGAIQAHPGARWLGAPEIFP